MPVKYNFELKLQCPFSLISSFKMDDVLDNEEELEDCDTEMSRTDDTFCYTIRGPKLHMKTIPKNVPEHVLRGLGKRKRYRRKTSLTINRRRRKNVTSSNQME